MINWMLVMDACYYAESGKRIIEEMWGEDKFTPSLYEINLFNQYIKFKYFIAGSKFILNKSPKMQRNL